MQSSRGRVWISLGRMWQGARGRGEHRLCYTVGGGDMVGKGSKLGGVLGVGTREHV